MKLSRVVAGTGIVALGLLGGLALKQAMFKQGLYVERYTDGRLIPPTGLLVNPSGLDGLANDVDDDFRRLYSAMLAYAKVEGTLPDDPRDLVSFTSDWPIGRRVTEECFYTPDYRKSDDYSPLDASFNYLWVYRSPRADGSDKNVPLPRGKRDVWIATEAYVRREKRVFRDGSYTSSPHGSYVVLWSDGEVERLGLDQRVTARSGERGSAFFFKGESGKAKEMTPSDENEARKGRWWPPPGPSQEKPDLSVG